MNRSVNGTDFVYVSDPRPVPMIILLAVLFAICFCGSMCFAKCVQDTCLRFLYPALATTDRVMPDLTELEGVEAVDAMSDMREFADNKDEGEVGIEMEAV